MNMEGLAYKVLKYSMAVSLVLALILLYLTFGIVPAWLYASLTTGTVAYALAFAGVVKRVRASYVAAGFLAVLILAVSLPAPAHMQFITRGMIVQASIFIIGSVLQIIILSALVMHILQRRRLSQRPQQLP